MRGWPRSSGLGPGPSAGATATGWNGFAASRVSAKKHAHTSMITAIAIGRRGSSPCP